MEGGESAVAKGSRLANGSTALLEGMGLRWFGIDVVLGRGALNKSIEKSPTKASMGSIGFAGVCSGVLVVETGACMGFGAGGL